MSPAKSTLVRSASSARTRWESGTRLTMRPVLKLSTVSSGFELAATRRLLFLCDAQAKAKEQEYAQADEKQKHIR